MEVSQAQIQPMIRFADLEFRYDRGDFSLRVADLAVDRGAAVALIGPSGSGKTTLLHLVCGIQAPSRGRIDVDGTEVSGLSEAARREFRITRIGLVFQEFELLTYLSVIENILLPYRMSSALTMTSEVRDRAASMAEELGLQEKLSIRPTQLSHGERQRVAVCRSLLPEPPLILADEPTGNLDPGNKAKVLEALLQACQKRGTTLVTVTHDLGVLRLFDRVVDIHDIGGDREG